MTDKFMHNRYVKMGAVVSLSLACILFTQFVKLLKNPESTPITGMTLVGLVCLLAFSLLGVWVSDLSKKIDNKYVQDFPILGWVSIVSIIFCLLSPFVVEAIQSVDFLAITTTILAFAGISVANQLVELSKTSWKILIVAIFVFAGAYTVTTMVANLGLLIAG
ncbi:hypothetical protein [Hutsoniella sourekii]|uniref:hypothetical protein n=1 Tax=Hutsoniella sourekii TaxID=87650 RepID=UPI000489F8A4|nr:hypothetical protein [Hutsoniella sourekii]